jgi:hypothetical protein
MGDAMFVTGPSVTYTAAEWRKQNYGIFTNGVISGLALSVGSGRNVTVSAGFAVIPDSTGTGSYIATLDSNTDQIIAANATSSIYLVVNPSGAQCTLATGATPTNPYITLGSGVAGASTITSVSNTRTQADFRARAGSFVQKIGDTISGLLTTSKLRVGAGSDSGTDPAVGSIFRTDVLAKQGIRLGGAVNPMQRHYARIVRTTAQSITSGTWNSLTGFTKAVEYNDYGNPGDTYNLASGHLFARVTGVYQISGSIFFSNTSSDTGLRSSRILMYDPSGNQIWTNVTGRVFAGEATDSNYLSFDRTVTMINGSYLQFQAWQQQGTTISVNPSGQDINSGNATWASLALLQAI